MKHDPTNVLHVPNVRVRDMLDLCSDKDAIFIAESIAAHRLAGLETHSIEQMLNKEITRMKAATRIFCGRIPEMP